MLGRTAGSLFWMSRYLERAENIARLIEAGFQIALTSSSEREMIWQSVITTAAVQDDFAAKHEVASRENVVDYLLRDRSHPNSVLSMIEQARDNARAARTALTREVWEATNSTWLLLEEEFRRPVKERDLPSALEMIRQQSALVRGALHGTMLQNDIYDFLRLGTFVERFEATARILDVKYYVLLPSSSHIGSKEDNIQWETILRSVSGHQSYRWLYQGQIDPAGISDYLIFDRRFPRSLAFSLGEILNHLNALAEEYGEESEALQSASALRQNLKNVDVNAVFDIGLHEFLNDMIANNARLSRQIEIDYRFYE